MSDGLLYAARMGVKALVDRGRMQGMPIRYIWAHRQSNKDRGRDPGEEIWKRVVLEYAVPVLGLEIQPDLRVGDGNPIPASWMDMTIPAPPRRWRRKIGIGVGILSLLASAGLAGWTVYEGTRRSP
jgi:hypothetical protein